MAKHQLDQRVSSGMRLPRYLVDPSIPFDQLSRWAVVDMRNSGFDRAFAIYDAVIRKIASQADELFRHSRSREFLRASRMYNRMQTAHLQLLRRWNTRERVRARLGACSETHVGDTLRARDSFLCPTQGGFDEQRFRKTKKHSEDDRQIHRSGPLEQRRVVLVFRREHGGRTYVRVRTWNRHRTKHVWYPTKRFYVIPVERVDALAEALKAAARDEPMAKKPRWYAAREKRDQESYEWLVDLEAPDASIEKQERQLERRKKSRV